MSEVENKIDELIERVKKYRVTAYAKIIKCTQGTAD